MSEPRQRGHRDHPSRSRRTVVVEEAGGTSPGRPTTPPPEESSKHQPAYCAPDSSHTTESSTSYQYATAGYPIATYVSSTPQQAYAASNYSHQHAHPYTQEHMHDSIFSQQAGSTQTDEDDSVLSQQAERSGHAASPKYPAYNTHSTGGTTVSVHGRAESASNYSSSQWIWSAEYQRWYYLDSNGIVHWS